MAPRQTSASGPPLDAALARALDRATTPEAIEAVCRAIEARQRAGRS